MFKKRIPFYLFTTLLLFFVQFAFSQTKVIQKTDSTATVYPGLHYKKSGVHNFFWGKHYRKEWATAVTVPLFFIDTANGGLTVVKEAGSRQSMGLRLKDKKGHEYVLRSIDKDFGNGLPEIFHGTFISNIAKDQASIGYPFAAITITPLISAAGIYHTNPKIVFVPDQPALNGYEKYKDQLYLFEERADEDWSDAAFFGNSKNIIGSEKLFENLYEDNDNSVNAKAFAKARLFDMFIGDWGRHADQWRWASFENGKQTIYKPIPRDRDQAYTKFDGFFPLIATNVAGAVHLESFDGDINNVKRFNQPGYPLDNSFLISLEEKDWVNEANDLQTSLTDAVIENAIKQLPADLYSINGEKIIKALKSRRDDLEKYAKAYYQYLNKRVSIKGSDKKEKIVIQTPDKTHVRIALYKIDKNDNTADVPYFDRTFDSKTTHKIFVYGFKGKDVIDISGQQRNKTEIHLVGFTKKDSLVQQYDAARKIVKIHEGDMDTYDTLMQHPFKISPVIFISSSAYKVFTNDPLNLFTKPGLHIGVNFKYKSKPWKRDSLEALHQLAFNYGFLRKTLYAEYVGMFPGVIGKADFILKGRFETPAAENFFGVGNETTRSGSTAYYNIFSTRIFGGAGVQQNFKHHHVEAGLFYQQIKVGANTGKYFSNNNINSLLLSWQKFAGVEAGYELRLINDELLPTKGITYSAAAGYIFNLNDGDKSFAKANTSLAAYLPLSKKFSVAARVGAETVTGSPYYYHLAKLGGNENLRGFPRERFYGKTIGYSNNEIRFITNTRNIIFNGKIGLLAFTDFGRVWQPAENSSTIHTGYGGGLILSPFNKVVLTGTYGLSKEGNQILFQARLFF